MQALTLMVVYVVTTLTVQFIGFLISRVIDYEWPTLGLMSFLIRRAGYTVETAQSGGYIVEERKTRRAAV